MPHYIKLLRNHFLDKGLLLANGTDVSLQILQEVLSNGIGEVKLCHKLNPSLLALKRNERQRVASAKAVFSKTVVSLVLPFNE